MKLLPKTVTTQLANLKYRAFQKVQWSFHINRVTAQVYRSGRLPLNVHDAVSKEMRDRAT